MFPSQQGPGSKMYIVLGLGRWSPDLGPDVATNLEQDACGLINCFFPILNCSLCTALCEYYEYLYRGRSAVS